MTEQATPLRPLGERIESGEVECYYTKVHLLPGAPAAKTYTFLLVLPLGGHEFDKWLPMLERAGYAGSTVVATFNFPSVDNVIMTDQIDGIIMWDADMCKKRYVVEESLERQLRVPGARTKMPPWLFVFEDPCYPEWGEEPLKKFLAEHFPLS